MNIRANYDDWKNICDIIADKLEVDNDTRIDNVIYEISKRVPDNSIVTTDVGQNQVWVAQKYNVSRNTQIIFSGGHVAMGYSLPASIGASLKKSNPVISFLGDGGFQMNIQELEFIAREKLPILIVVINNNSLGMIRHFQEIYFSDNNPQTVIGQGYSVPDFVSVANAYKIKGYKIFSVDDLNEDMFLFKEPLLLEIFSNEKTYVKPRLKFGTSNQDQEPLIDRKLYEYLMGI